MLGSDQFEAETKVKHVTQFSPYVLREDLFHIEKHIYQISDQQLRIFVASEFLVTTTSKYKPTVGGWENKYQSFFRPRG